MEIKKAALVGFGAIGCVYAKNLIKSIGDDFVVIAGEAEPKGYVLKALW